MRTDPRTTVPKADEQLKAPYPHRTPAEQADDQQMVELDERLKDYGIEKKEGDK